MTDGFYGDKGLVTYRQSFWGKTDKIMLHCKLWSYNPAKMNLFIDVLSFVTGRNIPIILANYSIVTSSNLI